MSRIIGSTGIPAAIRRSAPITSGTHATSTIQEIRSVPLGLSRWSFRISSSNGPPVNSEKPRSVSVAIYFGVT